MKKISLFVLRKLNISEHLIIPEKSFFKFSHRHKLKNFRENRVAVFLGCGGKYIYPETADRFVQILRGSGIQTVIPKDQVCCGNPLVYSGLTKNISLNNTRNISAFNSLLEISFMVSLCSGASTTLKILEKSTSSESFRFEVKDYAEFILNQAIEIQPEYENKILFHSCPKCGNKNIFTEFVKVLYKNSKSIPPFTSDYCGSTELFNRSAEKFRNEITKSFCDKNKISDYNFVACSSFECVEYLTYYLAKNNYKTKAIHFIDALKN